MINDLFLHRFPVDHSLSPDKVDLALEEFSSDFSLSDFKACNPCKNNPERKSRLDCNCEILKVHVENDTVTVINLEDYLSQYKDIRDRCDYLLLDQTEHHRKICFCDLTCSAEKWVVPNDGKYSNGKMAKAKQQMIRSLEYLLDDSLFGVFILTFVEKNCIFGWRDYDAPAILSAPLRNDVLGNMLVFGTTPSSMAHEIRIEEQIMEHHFTFVKVKYPNEYVW